MERGIEQGKLFYYPESFLEKNCFTPEYSELLRKITLEEMKKPSYCSQCWHFAYDRYWEGICLLLGEKRNELDYRCLQFNRRRQTK